MNPVGLGTDLGRLRIYGGLRIAFAAFWLANLALLASRIWQFGSVPEGLWRPISVALLYGDMPARSYVGLLWLVAAGSTTLVGLGLFTRQAGAVAVSSSVLLGSVLFSIGKLIHSTQILILFALVMAFSDWGQALSVDAWRARRAGRPRLLAPVAHPGWPLRVAVGTIGLLYLASGLIKLVRGHFLSSGNMGQFLQLRAAMRGSRGSDAPGWVDLLVDWLVAHPTATTAMAWGALAIELGFLVALLAPRVRLLVLAGAVAFHGAIGTLTDLTFYTNVYLLAALFVASLLLVLRSRSALLQRWLPSRQLPATGPSSLPMTAFWMAGSFVCLFVLERFMTGSGDLGAAAVAQVLRATLPDPARPGVLRAALVLGSLAAVVMLAWLGRDVWRIAAGRSDGVNRTLLYDGDCGFCQRWVAWCHRRGAGSRVSFAPCQDASQLRQRAGISLNDCSHAAFLVEEGADGALGRRRGAGAVAGVLEQLPGFRHAGLRLLGALYRLQGIRHVADAVYAWVAANRHRIGRVACDTGAADANR